MNYGGLRVEEAGDDWFPNEEGGEKGGSRRWERAVPSEKRKAGARWK